MGGYDWFARIYDRSLEPLYAEARQTAADALELKPGSVVLDLPCGTGQSFEFVAPRLDPTGILIGIDASPGMLRQARRRVREREWPNVHLGCRTVGDLNAAALAEIVGSEVLVDRVLVFLGLTVFPDWETAFEHLWRVLVPRGRMVIVDVHADRPGLQGHLVNLVAGADIRRRTWQPLMSIASDFEHRTLPSRRSHGGQLFLAVGTKAQEPT